VLCGCDCDCDCDCIFVKMMKCASPARSFFIPSKRRNIIIINQMGYIDADTYLTTESFDVCLRATAIWVRALNDVDVDDHRSSRSSADDDGDGDTAACYSYSYSFALTRPPGHHATYTSSNGFCVYNFAAAAAIHASSSTTTPTRRGEKQRRRRRVAILDWDVHYGQGIADIVQRQQQRQQQQQQSDEEEQYEYDEPPRIRYVSIHQTPAFPYEGGQRRTVSNVRTIPIPPDTTWTSGYEAAFRDALDFCCGGGGDSSDHPDENNVWQPDVIIVCAGYDALASDELAGTSLTQDDYYQMTRLLLDRIQSLPMPRPKLMFGLEGGYQLRDECGPCGNFPDAVVRTLQALMEGPSLSSATL
jgi:acetoin utilization deacetylase AcuC-like enzyme